METIVFLDRATVPVPFRAPSFPHRWREHDRTSPSETTERLVEATLVVTNKVVLRAADLARAPKLRFIAEAAAGKGML